MSYLTGIYSTRFLSTPSGWRATTPFELTPQPAPDISIHTLRVEGDTADNGYKNSHCNFYPRPPGGGRPLSSQSSTQRTGFLSTPSGWRATFLKIHDVKRGHFYPRPPGGGRPKMYEKSKAPLYFYPRPPGGGRPDGMADQGREALHFYPRPPGGGRPSTPCRRISGMAFLSTPSGWRATRAGAFTASISRYFYPRPPGGGRQEG